jgi:hypothetical protein
MHEVLRSSGGAFVVHYPPRLAAMAETIDGLLCESAVEIASSIGLESIDTINVFIAPDGDSYKSLHRGSLPEWSAAFSLTGSQVLGLNAEAVLRTPRPMKTVVLHELSHLLFAQRIGDVSCPVWFLEGLAMLQSHEWSFADQWELMVAVSRRELPYLDELSGRFPQPAEEASLAYRLSYAAVDELLSAREDDLATLVAFIRELGDFGEAFLATFGETPEDFDVRIHVLIVKRYRTAGTLLHTSPYWAGLTLLFLIVFVVKRARSRRISKRWEQGDSGEV